MTESSEYCELVLSIDKREKDQERISEISSFFESHGGIVQMESSPRCDYRIQGNFRDHEVNLGIEVKVLLGDFFPSLEDMPGKFFEAYKFYKDVALFIEEGNYALKVTDDGLDAWVQNPAMQAMTGAEGIGILAMYNNFCGSMAEAGLHVRTYRTNKHFPLTVSGLLKNIVKPVHRGISLGKPINQQQILMNMLVHIEGIGAKKAEHGTKYIPNIKRAGELSQVDYQMVFGDLTGKKVFRCINDDSRKEECAKNWIELEIKTAPKKSLDMKESIDKTIQDNQKEKKNSKVSKEKENVPEIKITKEDNNNTLSLIKGQLKIFQDIKSKMSERDLLPRVKDVVEFIRQKPRTIKEVQEYFGFTPQYCFETLMKFKTEGKIWYDLQNKLWSFGGDKNPMPVTAEPEMDVGL